MKNFGKKKVAICFSGQPRTWKNCIETWKNILTEKNFSVDIFCHIWDFNSVPNCVQVGNPMESVKIPREEIDELIKFLRPKKFLVESEKIIKPINGKQVVSYSSFLSQYYGILMAARLKKKYEIEHNINYDVVVRARYDAYYQSPIFDQYDAVQEHVMHGFHFGWNNDTKRGRIGDICWFADTQTYDIICDYFLNIENINLKFFNKPTPEEVFFHYIKKNKINIQINHWDIKLFRQSQELSFTKNKDGFEIW